MISRRDAKTQRDRCWRLCGLARCHSFRSSKSPAHGFRGKCEVGRRDCPIVGGNGVESGELAQDAAVAGHFGVPPIMVAGDEATCREAEKFFGKACVTVAVKKGIARESALLYPFEETRKALYEGARRAMAAIPDCASPTGSTCRSKPKSSI